MGNTFFGSDLHLLHVKVSELRGFSSVEEHDEVLIKNWCEDVHPDDVVWLLGDLQASNPDRALEIIKSLPGKKHLVAGNHDPVHSMHRTAHKYQRQYLEVFDSVQVFARRKILGQSVLLSHFPYVSDHTETARYMQYRLPDKGELLLHGHTHSSVQRTSTRELHVGVDAWDLRLVPLARVTEFVEENL